MIIYLNETAKECTENLSLAQFLKSEQLIEASGIAVAVNQCVVSRADWETHLLQSEDKVLIIRATQGG
ncbi:sulfur carrier protein ThiS [Persicobacter psychrovividus]|uniref:Thiamine biosynthesis protein ThiS n=1 Tax=Persicobacter psychrovividus TaxID=387638 RepID=A0ABN6L7W3_9BACT|nr:hypothetical protein PEPS_11940 [Persicobacter psychrovividus]